MLDLTGYQSEETFGAPMRYFILVLLIISQVACVGSSKTRPNLATYDFGLAVQPNPDQRLIAKIGVEEITAAESLNYQQMRYRLNYENTSRILFYADSRWSSAPPELLSSKLNTMLQLSQQPLNCSLKLKLQVFDQVFTSPATSEGVVQMSVVLVDKKTRKVLSTDLISASVAATTPNAAGGASALSQASENALVKAISWANAQAEQNPLCHI
ncbi:MAG TPA: hypothetical protein VIE91_02545 [Methylophilaceae bacterium]